jgi:hypothetical protein
MKAGLALFCRISRVSAMVVAEAGAGVQAQPFVPGLPTAASPRGLME